jgi:hypothetical protein
MDDESIPQHQDHLITLRVQLERVREIARRENLALFQRQAIVDAPPSSFLSPQNFDSSEETPDSNRPPAE